ncbi:GNAT family N-acetyltransferase [Labrys wisconsinensis]|uniref:CelD/BcsL family acetyltransferase involved in cellulose biosynthesis n=1 Tax=Labrys wisconsinensis TaxID=425677 RepID=A0ABU0J548_9HYPH|nr:GNAT family N-acetyltransferase [Labrys wisconsinensis]MDQ0469385.1 CelD/BcsL family acetyltransferase involved in cellulose biosynthesis [Labrys wisconsinensis]
MADVLSSDPSVLLDTASEAAAGMAVTVAAGIDAVAEDWRALERRAAISPYQRFDFIAAWVRHAAAEAGLEARIGVVRDGAGRVVAILPFGVKAGRLAASAHYLGGSHVNINMPLVDPSFARTLTPAAVETLLDDYCAAAGADLLILAYQPESWFGAPHPFATLPRQPSPDNVRFIRIESGYAGFMEAQLSADGRRKLRSKAKRFAEAGANLALHAGSPACVDRLTEAFFAQKAKRLQAMGADDPFSSPGTAAFLREAALAGLGGEGGLEFHGVEVGGAVIAVRGGLRHRDQFSLMVQSFDQEHPLARYSPGEMLLMGLIEECCARGVHQIDFGVGDARYKDTWSNAEVAMFDVTHPVTARGVAVALGARLRTALVRSIKQNKPLYESLKAWRARLTRG